ncbi:MAG: DUF2207 domain-containing protein [Acidobacteria bacterium]|nr:DUF2207 domain-containing protein [Acidobacteriota bacterium]MBV9477301.1 DUF2207 domain-containing protein [Acidobacteriota bacterium]
MRRTAVLLLFLASPLFGKTLHWTSIDVDAHLDAEGYLHVVERQAMVFDGDWNGGERSFNLRGKQEITLNSVKRIDGGREIALEEGNLDAVDRYAFTSHGVLRWRSRLPSDPPFSNQELTYVLDYVESNVLVPEGGTGYSLAHDFGLPERSGEVERFTLHVTFDPVWSGATPVALTREHLAPGEHVIVREQLTYAGARAPSGVAGVLPRWIGRGFLLGFLAIVALLVVSFIAGERPTGRFDKVEPRFDPLLLELPPEIAGAAWDDDVGSAEVAATLARMTQEGKLATRVDDDVLHLTLKVDRNSLRDYEGALIAKLFFDGRIETDTDAIKKHYRSSGFDPGKAISDGVLAQLQTRPEWQLTSPRFILGPRVLVFLAAAAMVIVAGVRAPDEPNRMAAALGGFLTFFFAVFAWVIAASAARKAIAHTRGAFISATVGCTLASLPALLCCLNASTWGLEPLTIAGLTALALAVLWLAIDLMKIQDAPEKIRFRKRIAGARDFFAQQLALPNPALRDEWFPYVLAFGLGKHVDRWFRAYGGASAHTMNTATWSSSSSSSSGSSGSSWTGGGGAFGGAGATGSWAVAVGAMSAGVSAPSSSSSGGGASSGGGGGGGW